MRGLAPAVAKIQGFGFFGHADIQLIDEESDGSHKR
jgi:hypothetical protein